MKIISVSCLIYKNLHLTLIRSKRRRKTLSLQIQEGRKVVLHVPYHMPIGEVERFVKDNQSWIKKRLVEKERIQKKPNHSFRPGEVFPYLGDWYPLEIEETEKKGLPLQLCFGRFLIKEGYRGKARELFINWYKKEAKRIIEERVKYHSKKLKLFPKGIKVTSAKYRWGSCSAENRLSFTWRVIMAPLSVVDYIVVHELLHLKEKNHSKRFWTYLEEIFPNYRKEKLWLRKNGNELFF